MAVEFFSPPGRPRPRPRGALPPPRPPRTACPPPRVPPLPRPNANTGAGAVERPVLLRNAGGAGSDETAAARTPQSCTPGRGAAALAAGRAARAASAAAIVPGTLLSPALFAIRPLSASSAAGPGRDISPPDPEPEPRDLEPQPEPQDLEPEPQDLELAAAPRSSARRVHTVSSRSSSDRRQLGSLFCTHQHTRGQERGRGTRETSSPNARPRPNALAIPRSPTPSGSSRHAWPATRSAHLSKHTRAAPGRAVHLVATPIVEAGRGAKTNGVNSAAPPPS